MKVDSLAQTQLLLAQALETLSEHIRASTGYQITPVKFAQLPSPAKMGMIACITDSNTQNFGSNISPMREGRAGALPGPYQVLAWYNGTNWTVIGQ